MGADPDVAAAIPALEREGVLAPALAARLLRIAKGELISVHYELRLLLYVGVLLVAAGAGLLVKENLERIGPTVVALAIGLAAAACLVWVTRTSPPYSRGEVVSPHFAFDYILLLGALLVAADLAYVEVQFTPLGASWTWHLLFVSILYGGLAFRFDSRTLFSLSLSTFAAWRGVSLAVFARRLGMSMDARIAVEAVICGLGFVLLGVLLDRAAIKRHFEPCAVHLGCLAVFAGCCYRLGSVNWEAWALLLVLSGLAVATVAYRSSRFWLFAMGVVAAHVALTRWVGEATGRHYQVFFLWLVISGLAVVVGLGAMHRRLREGP